MRQTQTGRVAAEPPGIAVGKPRFEYRLIFRRERRLLTASRRLGQVELAADTSRALDDLRQGKVLGRVVITP